MITQFIILGVINRVLKNGEVMNIKIKSLLLVALLVGTIVQIKCFDIGVGIGPIGAEVGIGGGGIGAYGGIGYGPGIGVGVGTPYYGYGSYYPYDYGYYGY